MSKRFEQGGAENFFPQNFTVAQVQQNKQLFVRNQNWHQFIIFAIALYNT